MKLAFESKLNILLSELLNQMGVTSHSEYLGQGRKDVLTYHQGLAIVLEGSYEKQDAEKDAKKRIEQLAADVALAVHYPSVFPQDLTELSIGVPS
jgi:methionyl-tRNA formyltransferase